MDLYNLTVQFNQVEDGDYQKLFLVDESKFSLKSLIKAVKLSSVNLFSDSLLQFSGTLNSVLDAKGYLQRNNQSKSVSNIKFNKFDLLLNDDLNNLNSIKLNFKNLLIKLNSDLNLNFSLSYFNNLPTSTQHSHHQPSLQFNLHFKPKIYLNIHGSRHLIDHSKVLILLEFDKSLGLHTDYVDIDSKLIPIIASKKRSLIRNIEEETESNIYLPNPLNGIFGNDQNLPEVPNFNSIFISGDFFGVQRAKDMLLKVALQKLNSKSILSRDAALLPRKLDCILLEKSDELRTIMSDNGTFIKFPIIGSQSSVVQVFGDNRVSIERSIRSLMQLACNYYVASVWLLPVTFDVLIPPPSINSSTVPPQLLQSLCAQTGAEIVLKSNCFEAHGSDTSVKEAISKILELDIVQGFHHEIRFQVELANEHRDFISGKKNGKINKIMKSANVRIKYETLSEYNFLIDVAGSDLGALSGLNMLQEELPAEMSFHVPEVYHKRIIGVGGKNIQRIMKKFGVYVKFSNADEFAALGGYCDNEDNVISRTPAKNAMNLENLKQSVMELVNPKDKDYTTESILIPRKYHRTLIGEKSIFLHDIESKTGCKVRFPDKELATDSVNIFGPEHQVNIAKTMVLDHVPFEAEYLAPRSNELISAISDTQFVETTNSILNDLHVTIISPQINTDLQNSSSSSPVEFENNDENLVFKFRCQRSNIDMLGAAKDSIEDYLKGKNVMVYNQANQANQNTIQTDTLAGVFPLFNSKIISTTESPTRETFGDSVHNPNVGGSRHQTLASNSIGGGSSAQSILKQPNYTGSSTLGGTKTGGAVGSGRRLRAAVSTPNVKALFGNEGPGNYVAGSTVSSPDSNSAFSSPFGGIVDDVISLPSAQVQVQQMQHAQAQAAAAAYYAAASQQAQEQHYTQSVWGPPTPPMNYMRPPQSSTTTAQSQQPPAQPTTAADATKSYARTAEDALKRGSDSVLEAKLKAQPQRTLASQRAQSLDLGALVGKTNNSTNNNNNVVGNTYRGAVGESTSPSGGSILQSHKPNRASHLNHQSHYSIGGPISNLADQTYLYGGHNHTRSLPQAYGSLNVDDQSNNYYSPISPPQNPIGTSSSIYAQPTQPSLRHARSLSTNPRSTLGGNNNNNSNNNNNNTVNNIPKPITIPSTESIFGSQPPSATSTTFTYPNTAASTTNTSSHPSRLQTPTTAFEQSLSSDQANEISRVLAQVRLDQS